ncbi:CheA signal transduction histidine kinase [Modicisalibacter ilicicola DSM 19980]|uniref:Chemotaxis protein CheA n=1 Tax=Modicisalibacter ilicicola DSM 19980 TaxID=1121942 RepID=A0A1M5CMN4_9GAMM|nr:chemotaxis protein CheA [Halomonas ilicicola]SHF55926.1 CheA signal transduction histidine kinase [Halomonas ilicicola DSM 19980]
MDITDFYDTFFEEAEELLGDMERHLLELDVDEPDPEQLNAIFRAAHSIKGGAGTFGFLVLQETTHILENLLDHTRRGELALRRDIVDTFLEAKDVLHDQMDAYRNGEEPDPEAFERIRETLQKIALNELGKSLGGDASAAKAKPEPAPEPEPAPSPAPTSAPQSTTPLDPMDQFIAAISPDDAVGETQDPTLCVALLGVNEKDRALLVEELAQLGSVLEQHGDEKRYEVTLETSVSREDIEAVMCFIIESEQLEIGTGQKSGTAARSSEDETVVPQPEPQEVSRPQASEPEPQAETPAPQAAPTPAKPAEAAPAKAAKPPAKPQGGKAKTSGESSLRVPVDKVDQIINLVGELIITQSMLDQTASEIDGVTHSALYNGLNLLQRNARDLQEAVMSIRMMPMDYVFSRFPRLVRDLAAKLNKDVELVTEGKSTELDKSLIERIIDPLTHLVRNSLDHGIELPDQREAAGKPRGGKLTLSAQHQGGNILIEVIDDGAGLNRNKLLAKAEANGLAVSDSMSDDEVWQLIFAPGFSTAEQVSDVSGRGVGMDVVKRNIQSMGGHVEILSREGQGTTTRIVLPLTLAILDGMSIKVGEEVFILPLGAVLESLQPCQADLYTMAGDDQLLKVRDEYLPVIALHQVLDIENARTTLTECIVVIVQAEGRRYALMVDDLVGQQQVVVKNLETNYRKVPGISAATILGDGSVALILDIADLHRLSRRKTARQANKSIKPTQEALLS